jgi:uncharacterized protein (TIGR02996 family)
MMQYRFASSPWSGPPTGSSTAASVSGEDPDEIGFESLPTGRFGFGLGAVTARGRAPGPVRAHGTPRLVLPLPAPPRESAQIGVPALPRESAQREAPAAAPEGKPAQIEAAAPARAPAQVEAATPARELTPIRVPAPLRAAAPARLFARSPVLVPAPAPSPFTSEVPTIPDSLWSGAASLLDGAASLLDGAPSLFDGTTLGKTPLPADLLAVGLIEEDAPLDRDAAERGLLAAIAAGDEAARLRYADWLEQRDEHARAGFLRIEQLVSRLSPGDPRYEACTRQLRELVQHVDAAWRARVARPPIEGCPAQTARCPRRWDALARTDREDVRHCGPCGKRVTFFESVDEAREAARRGEHVAIDLGAERWENDLVDPGVRCGSCARRVVSTARYCPHCGAALRETDAEVDPLDATEMQLGDTAPLGETEMLARAPTALDETEMQVRVIEVD